MKTNRHTIAFVAILLTAAALRLIALDAVPPGINHDEASNGYDGYSLLKTGRDRWGVPFPVVLEAFGRADYRGAVYAYLTIPFHAIAGPERLVWSTRMPAAVFGVITVWALHALVARLGDRTTALWAMLMLAVSPWHVQLSRFGHESSLTPACAVVGLLFLVRAVRPRSHNPALAIDPAQTLATDIAQPIAASASNRIVLRTAPCVGAGVVLATSLYTYGSMRVFTPSMVFAGLLMFRRDIAAMWRTRDRRRTMLTGVAAFMMTAAPLIYVHVTRWDQVTARARQVSVFHNADSFASALLTATRNYAAHFSPVWLITHGDPSVILSPRAHGQLDPVVVMFMIVGVVVAISRVRTQRWYAVPLAWLILHPVTASLTIDGPHALRSACGLPVFPWLAAIGCQAIVSPFVTSGSKRHAVNALCAAGILLAAGRNLYHYYFEWARDPVVTSRYQVDLCNAMRAIRPLVADYDRVFVSDQEDAQRHWFSGESYIIALLLLPVDPAEFHRWGKSVDYVRPTDGFHRVESFGPFVMTTQSDVFHRILGRNLHPSALVVARPGEITGGRLLSTVNDDSGAARFNIISLRP